MAWNSRMIVRVSKPQGVIASRVLIVCIYVFLVSMAYILLLPIFREGLQNLDIRRLKNRFENGHIILEVNQPETIYDEDHEFGEESEVEEDILSNLDIDCDPVISRVKINSSTYRNLERWSFDDNTVIKRILDSPDRCQTIRNLFSFPVEPLTDEEKNYPLAYGILVYRNFVQVLFMLSSFYQPQNHYCIAVSGSATREFKTLIQLTTDCFDNVYIMKRPSIVWGGFEIINSTYRCMESLTIRSNWKYFQYLSGVDVPLKTNLETVRILKQWNNTANVEFIPFQLQRLRQKKAESSPLPLYKASLSAVIPRDAAEYLIQSPTTIKLLTFLHGTGIPDESFWGTLFGNKNLFNVPGSLEAEEFLLAQSNVTRSPMDVANPNYMTYYLSRYQVWASSIFCRGKYSSGSCVYGVHDVPHLLKKPHLVAHKLYMNFQPAAYFCILKEIRRRSLNFITDTGRFKYSESPLVELKAGRSYEDLTHPEWLLK